MRRTQATLDELTVPVNANGGASAAGCAYRAESRLCHGCPVKHAELSTAGCLEKYCPDSDGGLLEQPGKSFF